MRNMKLMCSGLLMLFACSKFEREVEQALPDQSQKLAVANAAATAPVTWRMVFSDESNLKGRHLKSRCGLSLTTDS